MDEQPTKATVGFDVCPPHPSKPTTIICLPPSPSVLPFSMPAVQVGVHSSDGTIATKDHDDGDQVCEEDEEQ